MTQEDFNIDEYLKKTDNEKYNPKKESKIKKISHNWKVFRSRRKKKLLKPKIDKERFSFKKVFRMFDLEAGVDILDEAELLYRRNRIIKRIVFITNILFSLFLLTRNYKIIVVSFLVFLFTFGVNQLLKSLIYSDPKNEVQQKTAMYFVSINTIAIAIAMFINLRIDAINAISSNMDFNQKLIYNSIANISYGLIFFSLTITAFYQNRKLMKHISYLTLFIYTIMHFAVIYPTYTYLIDIRSFVEFTDTPEFRDICIRTLVLVLFLLALNFNVRISEKMHEERKRELSQRRALEKDFMRVVEDIFDSVGIFNTANLYKDKFNSYRVAQIARKLAGLLKMNQNQIEEVFDFSKVHIDRRDYLTLMDYKYIKVLSEKDYEDIEERTKFAREIISRLRVNQFSEDLVRNHCHSTFGKRDFTVEKTTLDIKSQIVLLMDIYDALRMDRLYKNEFNHIESIRVIRENFSSHFDFQVLDRFIRYENEFREMYDNFIL